MSIGFSSSSAAYRRWHALDAMGLEAGKLLCGERSEDLIGLSIHATCLDSRVFARAARQRRQESLSVVKQAGAIKAFRAKPRVRNPDERSIILLNDVHRK